MLEVFKEKQPLFYEEVVNSVQNNKISHAYLIETNQYPGSKGLILSFVKYLFCKQHYLNHTNCGECNLCDLIDGNSLSDFMIIEPDGSWIKKNQVLEIKEKLKTTSIDNSYRIYWIRQADKLNKQAANSLLKFLEEPEGQVIAILETDNRYKVLETIRSRCQVYTFIHKSQQKELENYELLVKLIEVLENYKEHAIAYLPITLESDYQTRDFWISTFKNMITLYENAIRKSLDLSYLEYQELLDFIIKKNTLATMIHKIDVLFQYCNQLNYNLTVAMMFDRFIVDFSGGK